MLNTVLKSVYFFSIILLCNASLRNNGVIVLSLADALDLAHEKLPDSISDRYEYSIKSAYYYWLYNYNRFKFLNEKKVLLKDYMAVYELHFKSGEINLTTKVLAEAKYLNFESQYSEAEYNLLISENNLKKLIYINSDIIPESDSLDKYYLQENVRDESMQDSIIENYIDFSAQHDYLNLVLLLKKYDSQLIYYKKIFALAQQLTAKTGLRYDNEDIEYFHYINIISNAIDLKLEYLRTLDLYNQAALRIEMYNN
jgi:hypothetical protein